MYTRVSEETLEREWYMTIRRFSRGRDLLAEASSRLCGITGHRFEYFVHVVFEWAWRREQEILRWAITEDDAFRLDPRWVTTIKRIDRELAEEEEDDDDD